jgi:hypothetical protein
MKCTQCEAEGRTGPIEYTRVDDDNWQCDRGHVQDWTVVTV